jgi:hypothetical protein
VWDPVDTVEKRKKGKKNPGFAYERKRAFNEVSSKRPPHTQTKQDEMR